MKYKSILAALVILAVTALWADKKFTFTNSSLNPAAAGTIDVGTDQNGNNAFTIRAYHLAEPGQLTPAKSVYVVWVQRNGEAAQNLGQLTVNHDLEGTFDGKTPDKDFDVFITAEDSAKAETPSSMEVLRAKVQH